MLTSFHSRPTPCARPLSLTSRPMVPMICARRLLLLPLLLLWPVADARAQPEPPTVAFLALAGRENALVDALHQGFIENGLVPGQTVRVEARFANGDREKMQNAIADLVAMRTRVFIAAGPNVARMVQEVAPDAAIVVASLEVFESAGVQGSIARPAGNVTGFATLSGDLIAKRLALLVETIPGLAKVVAVTHPGNRNHAHLLTALRQSAATLGLEVAHVAAGRAEDLAPALAAAKAEGAGAAMFMRDFLFETHRRAVVDAAVSAGLPSTFDEAAFVHLGGLMSYSPSRPDLLRRSATYARKILAGEQPHNLPIQLPTSFDLVVNLKAARNLGLDVPSAILISASEIID